jgi:hypothetical protein
MPQFHPSYLRRHSALSRASSRQPGVKELERAATLFRSRGSADLLVPRAIPRSPGLRPRMYKPVAVRSDSRSTLHGHAAANRRRWSSPPKMFNGERSYTFKWLDALPH